MNEAELMTIATNALILTAKLALPVLLTSLAIGLGVSLFQSVTSIQEVTLTFVPKLAGVALVFFVAGHWMLSSMISYTESLYGQMATLAGG